jgi:hypothetical protein
MLRAPTLCDLQLKAGIETDHRKRCGGVDIPAPFARTGTHFVKTAWIPGRSEETLDSLTPALNSAAYPHSSYLLTLAEGATVAIGEAEKRPH